MEYSILPIFISGKFCIKHVSMLHVTILSIFPKERVLSQYQKRKIVITVSEIRDIKQQRVRVSETIRISETLRWST